MCARSVAGRTGGDALVLAVVQRGSQFYSSSTVFNQFRNWLRPNSAVLRDLLLPAFYAHAAAEEAAAEDAARAAERERGPDQRRNRGYDCHDRRRRHAGFAGEARQ